MKIARDCIAQIHYTLSDTAGVVLEDTREGGAPYALLVGHGNVVPGVDAALRGREAGDRFDVRVTPEQGFGVRAEGQIARLSKKHLAGKRKPKVGDSVVARTRDGYREVTVLKVGGSVVDVDMNHPLAGQSLAFDIEVIEVRAATPEELRHGHAHGPGGHEH